MRIAGVRSYAALDVKRRKLFPADDTIVNKSLPRDNLYIVPSTNKTDHQRL